MELRKYKLNLINERVLYWSGARAEWPLVHATGAPLCRTNLQTYMLLSSDRYSYRVVFHIEFKTQDPAGIPTRVRFLAFGRYHIKQASNYLIICCSPSKYPRRL
jgi:hypothetical protein